MLPVPMELLSFARRYPVWSVFALVLFSRAAFVLSPSLSLDDYKYLSNLPPKELLISQGRVGWLLLERFLAALGLAGPYWYVHSTILGCLALSWAGILYARVSLNSDPLNESGTTLIFALLFCIHPFHTEILTFREAFPFYATALLLAALAIQVLVTKTGSIAFAAGCALLLIATSINQLVLNIVAVVVLTHCIFATADGKVASCTGPSRAAMACLVAIGVNVLMTKVLCAWMGIVVESRARIIDPSSVAERLVMVGQLIIDLFRFKFFYPAPLLTALMALLAVVGTAVILASAKAWPVRIGRLALLVLLPFASIGVVAAGEIMWPAARTMVGFMLITSMFAATALRIIYRKFPAVAGIFLLMIVAGFVGISDTVALDQNRVNRQDQSNAIEIARRADGLGVNTLAFFGSWKAEIGLRTQDRDLNLSAFYIDWARGPALQEYTGRRWNIVSVSAIPDAAEVCAELDSWPKANSMVLYGETALICLH